MIHTQWLDSYSTCHNAFVEYFMLSLNVLIFFFAFICEYLCGMKFMLVCDGVLLLECTAFSLCMFININDVRSAVIHTYYQPLSNCLNLTNPVWPNQCRQ